jgi:ribose transport system substrate-binding protein
VDYFLEETRSRRTLPINVTEATLALILMRHSSHKRIRQWQSMLQPCWKTMTFFTLLVVLGSCHREAPATIAVIPRTTATPLWESEHLGAKATAAQSGVHIYWNAPTSEDDIEGQIAMVEHVISGRYQGLVLAPDHPQALITPVRRAMSQGLQVVVVGSPLSVPPGGRLSYVLNDEDAGARIAAQRVGDVLHGKGTVALLGINPNVIGIVTRTRCLEQYFQKNYPNIHIVVKRMGSFNEPHEYQVAEETLVAHPNLDAIVALSSASVHGVLWAISDRQTSHVKVIAFDRDDDPELMFDTPNLDSVVIEDTQKMGAEAVRQVLARHQGLPTPLVTQFEPVLLTRKNVIGTMRELRSMIDTFPIEMRSKWMVGP